jgi:hypothetical protein
MTDMEHQTVTRHRVAKENCYYCSLTPLPGKRSQAGVVYVRLIPVISSMRFGDYPS